MNSINKNIIVLFYNFLQNNDNYAFNQCSKHFNKIISETYTKQYNLKKISLQNKLLNLATPTEIVEFIHSKYKSKLKYSPYFERLFLFKNNKWNKYEKFEILFEYLINCENIKTVENLYLNFMHIFYTNIEYINNVTELKDECNRTINTELFINEIDKNKNLIGFTNGVYDLINNIFRITFSNDNIYKTVNYNYTKYSENKDDLFNFLKHIQPDDTIRNNLLEQTAECLNVKENKTLILTGNDMSISSYVKLITATFGKYCTFLNSDYISDGKIFNKRVIISKKYVGSEYDKLFDEYIYSDNFYSAEYMKFKRTWKTIIWLKSAIYKNIENSYLIKFCNRRVYFDTNKITQNGKKLRCRLSDINYDLWKSDFMLLLIDIYKKKYCD